MTLVTPDDLTLRPPRITIDVYKRVLKSKSSPALAEVEAIWREITTRGVDPSFALGQFLVESLYGTAGHAKVTKSWGNILWDAAWTPEADKYAPGNGYVYAKYSNWLQGVEDYCAYVRRYATTTDKRYGGICNTIDKCTARWVGRALDSKEHLTYVTTLINAINSNYEYVPETFVETGDKMIQVGLSEITTRTKYPVKNGTALYRGTNGDILKYASFGDGKPTTVGLCRFLGPVNQPWSDAKWAWGAVIVGTSSGGADPKGNVVYIKNPDKSKVVK